MLQQHLTARSTFKLVYQSNSPSQAQDGQMMIDGLALVALISSGMSFVTSVFRLMVRFPQSRG